MQTLLSWMKSHLVQGSIHQMESGLLKHQPLLILFHLGAKYLVSFSSRSLKTREKYINFAQLVLLSLYIFEGSLFTFQFWMISKQTSLKKYTNWPKPIYFFLVLRKREEKKKHIFRTSDTFCRDSIKRTWTRTNEFTWEEFDWCQNQRLCSTFDRK